MEFHVIRRLFDDKQIMNPMNPEEVFTCKDLVDGKSIIPRVNYPTTQITKSAARREDSRLRSNPS